MAKFTSIDLSAHFTASRVRGPAAWHPDIGEALKTLPSGQQTFWGIPFALGAAEEDGGRWLVLDREAEVVEVAAMARYVVVAHFCNISPLPAYPDALRLTILRVIPEPGEHLADYVLVYADGSEHRQPIRRRFEVNEAVTNWGQDAFAARPHQQHVPLDFRGPLGRVSDGGRFVKSRAGQLLAVRAGKPSSRQGDPRGPPGADRRRLPGRSRHHPVRRPGAPPAPAPAGVAARHAAG